MQEYELIIIGGGISGLGVAREAAQRGYHCLILEKEKCCRATSANSLRIIHGGFRYLQSLDFGRVFESISEQNYWLSAAPNYVKLLPCFLPLKRFGACRKNKAFLLEAD
jgi:glycerol-3-phosphate dehydrogenase